MNLLRAGLAGIAVLLLVVTFANLQAAVEAFACGSNPTPQCEADVAKGDALKAVAVKRAMLPGFAFVLAMGVGFVALTMPSTAGPQGNWAVFVARVNGWIARFEAAYHRRSALSQERAASKRSAEWQAYEAKLARIQAAEEAADPAFHELRQRLARGEVPASEFDRLRAALAASRPQNFPSAPVAPAPAPQGITAWGVFWAIVGAILFLGFVGWLLFALLLGAIFSGL